MRFSPRLKSSAKERTGFVVLIVLIGSLAWLSHSSASRFSGSSLNEAIPFRDSTPQKQKKDKKPQQSPTPHQCSTCPPPSPRKIYAPAIELPEAGACEIVLNSRSPHPIDVTPTLYTMDGEQVIGERVTLQPAEIRFVPIESLIPDRHKGRHRWGGIALSYTGGLLEVWAQIAFRGAGGKGSIDETFNLFEDQGSDTREAVCHDARKGKAVLSSRPGMAKIIIPILTTAEFSDGVSWLRILRRSQQSLFGGAPVSPRAATQIATQ